MKTGEQTANRFREIILSGTWVANTNFKKELADLNWEIATQKVKNLNTIAILTQHIHYYIAGILNVLEGGTLDIRDKFSFDFPPINSEREWMEIKNKLWGDAERFARHVEMMTEEKLNEHFVDEKYGNYQRNIDAMIEHSYYHLGQIVLIKKIIALEQRS
ncbi:MAG TPA: DUF1572 domain-containing protein [Chitinophagaceae bacterium]